MVSRIHALALMFAVGAFAAPDALAQSASGQTSDNKINIGMTRGTSRSTGESGRHRTGFGSMGGRGTRHANELNKTDPDGHEVGASFKVDGLSGTYGPEKKLDPSKINNDCATGYKVADVETTLGAGIKNPSGFHKKGSTSQKLAGINCSAGVEGTLAKGEFQCQLNLAGTADLGVDVRGGGSAGAGATLSCKCEGTSVVCEAFIGVKGELSGNIGGSICGLRLALGLGGEAGAGAGGKIQAGYVEGRGYGLALAGYLGVGVGAKVYIDPQLAGLIESSTYKCLAGKAVAAFNGVIDAFREAATAQASIPGGHGMMFLAP